MIDNRDKAIENYINRVLDKEFEFITENQVIPVVVDNEPYCLLDHYTFPEEGVCDINKLKDVLLCDLGDDLLKIDYDGILKVIRNVKGIVKAILDTGISRNSIILNLKGSFGVHNLFFRESSNEKLISDLLLCSEFLNDDLDILNVSFSYLDYIEQVYSIYLKAMSTRHFEFMLNSYLIPIIVTDNLGYNVGWTVHISDNTKITSDISCLKPDLIDGLRSIDESSEFINTDKITDFIDNADKLLKSINKTSNIGNLNNYTIETENSEKIYIRRSKKVLVKKLLNLYVKGIKVLDVY